MAQAEHDRAAIVPDEIVGDGVPTYYVSSFNLSGTSNEVVLIGNELSPTWGAEAVMQNPTLRPRVMIRLSPHSVKDLVDVLTNFVARYEEAYGELRTDYLLRKASEPR
jgi:hypothetical protein